MREKNQTDRKLKNLERQIRRVARQIGRCWTLLQKFPNYIEPRLELDIRNIRASKM